MDNSSLAHSKWNCKDHIVFAPKYRRIILKELWKRGNVYEGKSLRVSQ